jgi:hypothetical protein
VGKRRLGLIKYVLDLMYRARLGVSAQAMGIAQQAYEEALTYAQQRIQFGKPISEIPAVTNMLVEMRVKLEAMRTLLYFTGEAVDLKEKLEEKVARGSERGQRDADISTRAKEAHKIAGILTPLTKYVVTEGSNEIAYDALQIHGGAGYMREFRIERLARDARITNIYEGTSQLQIVAATGGVVTDVLGGFFAEHAAREYPAALAHLAGRVAEMRQLGLDCLARVVSRKDGAYLEVVARHLVEMYGCCLIGYLLLDHAQSNTHKAFIAKRYILGASALCKRHAETIESEVHADLLHAREILI